MEEMISKKLVAEKIQNRINDAKTYWEYGKTTHSTEMMNMWSAVITQMKTLALLLDVEVFID